MSKLKDSVSRLTSILDNEEQGTKLGVVDYNKHKGDNFVEAWNKKEPRSAEDMRDAYRLMVSRIEEPLSISIIEDMRNEFKGPYEERRKAESREQRDGMYEQALQIATA